MYCLDEELEYEKYPAKILIYSYEDKEVIPPHWHKNFELNYLLSGEWMVEIDEKVEKVCAPALISINCQEVHNLLPNDSTIAEKIAVIFDDAFLEKYQFDLNAQIIKVEDSLHPTEHVRELMEKLFFIYKEHHPFDSQEKINLIGRHYRDLQVKGIVYDLMYEILSYYVEPKQFKNKKQDYYRIRFQKVSKYISQHYMENITLEDVAQVMGVTREHCAREFKIHTQRTFKEYLTRCRILRAFPLLRDTDMNITEIARKTGFPNVRAFNKGFKDIFEMMPREKREQMKKIR